ncbi:MAG: hypothetical protein COV80_03750 [Parcubacteria group bacterium CG11_big_fil_rev_8_21_14_0_20_48_46]|nr:MAG: hypothetical protein AUK21_01320 [Parcubacteria group bacterium CG2_30_48_51]PIW79591.1 MAG: hypothetical protein COZ99_00200 [Parcubacteria group bacterium CG_4_8_14_3_um_filter_48_16]PIY78038.1 MAG: hypothetical protein COY83_01840 [Parcubacteria group bacterium CG_4_10_14_0_8_um_filter_48_154]PIZ77939.1 MAG: hypothetical protein COY03_01170 [bacterium CG_4_10_14_0_2_um_filter_48_144]PJC39996.1 MAG: hypothetical protein CO043_01380 [Parcubacteria group bacterium CG_4_9_14_0_2_um_filte
MIIISCGCKASNSIQQKTTYLFPAAVGENKSDRQNKGFAFIALLWRHPFIKSRRARPLIGCVFTLPFGKNIFCFCIFFYFCIFEACFFDFCKQYSTWHDFCLPANLWKNG